MAETIKIDLDIDAGSSLKTMGDLEASVESMMDELKQTDVASDRFKELQSSIAGATSKIKDMELGMEGLDMEQKSSEIGSFAAGLADTATGALALSGALGITNDSSEKMIENLVSGMAVAQTFRGGLDGIISAQKLMRNSTIASTVATGNATIAQRLLNAVMKANPIFILIGLIVSAVAAFALFSGSNEEAEEKAARLNATEERLNDTLSSQIDLLKQIQKIESESRKLAQTKEQLAIESKLLTLNDKLKDIRRDTPDDLQSIIYQQKLINAQEEKLIKVQNKARIENNKARVSDIFDQKQELALKLGKLTEERIAIENNSELTADKRIEFLDKISTHREMIFNKVKTLEAEEKNNDAIATNIKIENENRLSKVRIDNINKISDLNNKPTEKKDTGDGPSEEDLIDEELEGWRRWSVKKQTILVEQLTKGEITEKEFTAKSQELLRDRLDKEKVVLETYGLNLVDKNLEIAENDLEIRKRLDEEELARKKALDDKIVESEMTANQKLLQDSMEKASKKADVAKGYANSVNSLAQGIFEIQNNLGEQDSDAKEKRAKKQFKVQKAMNLGMAIIDGFKAITSSLAMAPLAIGPIPNPAGIASLALAATTSAINIAKIASTKYEGGGGGGAGPTAPTLSIASPDIRETPSTNLFGQGNEGSEGDSSQFSSQEQNGSQQIQAVVSWTDIEAVQNNDNNIQQEMQL